MSLPAAKITIRSNHRLNLFGRTGSGKTTQARRMLAASTSRWACLDAKHDFDVRGVPIVSRFKPKLAQQIIRIPVGGTDEQLAWDDTIWELWDRGNRIVYIDETTLLCPTRTLRPALGAAIRTGRTRGLGVWCGSQRPKDLPSAIFTETEHFLVWQLTFEPDREKVASFTSEVLYEPLARLRGHDFIYWNVLTDRGQIVRAA